MKKIAFIPTREKNPDCIVTSYLEEAGWEVKQLVSDSIFKAFSNAVKEATLNADDKVIFCHDDIDIISKTSYFNEIIDTALSEPKTGFIGIAGSKLLNHTGVWWDGVRTLPADERPFSGFIFHGEAIKDMYPTMYGSYGKVAVLDGVFLATTGKIVNTIQLKKPDVFEGEWDFYDIFYTLQTHWKGLANYTVPIIIKHSSEGQLAGRDSWHKNRTALLAKFADKLPARV